MDVARNVQELIGRTPVIELSPRGCPEGVKIYAKLEFFNPGGSVKDRIGRYLIESALRDGRLAAGGTVIEPTAGNTGIGLALAAIGKGLRVILVVPEHFSLEKQRLMRALGAEVVNTPSADGMQGAIRHAHELAGEYGGFVPQQFENPDNPRAHYETTGPELLEQMDGRIDLFMAGAGSGGTFTGITRYLREHLPHLRTAVVEPEGSIFNGGPPGPHRTEGIGNDFIPGTLDLSLADRVITVTDKAAFEGAAQLAREHGLLVGASSGAAFAAAMQVAAELMQGNIVTVFPDGSERYLSCGIYE